MRIVAGSLRGRKLLPIKGSAIRPTTDRVREAVFNILGRDLSAVRVLDLFAGTGAMGIEALSRGAGSAVFVDSRRDSLALVRKNLERLGLLERSRVIRWDIARSLHCLRGDTSGIALVFMDPPYRQNLIAPALLHLAASSALSPGARIVIEHAASEPLPRQMTGYTLADQRKYGKTFVSFLNYVMTPQTL